MSMLNQNQASLTTTYSSADLQGEWEFKVLKSSALAFRKPELLQKVREEEAHAGWMLLEKMDDGHLRFKRPLSARPNDHNLSFDAYRTHYGGSVIVRQIIFWVCLVGGAILLYLYFSNPL
jgi:hypothetical protein